MGPGVAFANAKAIFLYSHALAKPSSICTTPGNADAIRPSLENATVSTVGVMVMEVELVTARSTLIACGPPPPNTAALERIFVMRRIRVAPAPGGSNGTPRKLITLSTGGLEGRWP